MSPRIPTRCAPPSSLWEEGQEPGSEALSPRLTPSTLYLVPSPIGNWEDISLRALRVLGEVDLIAAEDPQVTGRLLAHFQLTGQLQPFQGLPDQEALVLDHLDRGQTVALMCDAGTPTIADPGARLVRRALKAGHRICSLPGPVAGMVALTASGLSPQRFAFDGFAPRGRADRIAFFQSLQSETRTMILYESPAYLRSTLTHLAHFLGTHREIVIATDLTSAHESYWHGTLADAPQAPATRRRKGVCTLIIAGRV